MGRTPEQPPEDKQPDDMSDGDDFSLFPNISPRTQKIIYGAVALAAVGGIYMAYNANQQPRPHVSALLVPSDDRAPLVQVTGDNNRVLNIPRGTRVEAFCYDLHSNNNFGSYRFVIDEGLYNGQEAQTDRSHLHTTGDPWPNTGMSQHGDPFNNLPLC